MKNKYRTIIFISLLITILLVGLFILFKNNDNNNNNDRNNLLQKPNEPYGFEYIEDWQKDVYNNLEKLEIGKSYFLKKDQKIEDVQLVLDLYNQNNPQLLPIIYSVIENEGLPNHSHTIRKNKWLTSDMDKSIERLNQIDEKTNQIIAKIPDNVDDYTKIKIIYDYFIENIKYNFIYEDDSTINLDSYEAYGALVKQTAVCSGQAKAFHYVARKAGIYVLYVSNNNHAWNIVWLDGKYYAVDTTARKFLMADDNQINYVGNIPTPDTNHSYFEQ